MYSRKHPRLPAFDYSTDGLYVVTVCTFGRRCVLGRVRGRTVITSALGDIVARQIAELPGRFPAVDVDMYVVMPDHVHAIVLLEARARQASPLRLGDVVGAFKSGSTREINRHRRTPGATVWQRGYHDHIVRDEDDLERIRQYLADNPLRWALDLERL